MSAQNNYNNNSFDLPGINTPTGNLRTENSMQKSKNRNEFSSIAEYKKRGNIIEIFY
jgi:hypothetical protein